MDWNDHYVKIMRVAGADPYACGEEQCNHSARNTFGMMLHHYFGTHHREHLNRTN